MKCTDPNKPKVALNIAILTIHDRRTSQEDDAGNYLNQVIINNGHQCLARTMSKDNVYQVRSIISQWIFDPAIHIILCNGGTGFHEKNATHKAITPLLDMHIDGFGEMFRFFSAADIGTSAMQSRAFAGKANDTLIFCMPGSVNACQLAWTQILQEQLDSHHGPCNFASGFAA